MPRWHGALGAMDRATRSTVLVLVGVAILTIVVRGSFRFYVTPAMRWPLLLTGAVFVLLAVADTILFAAQTRRAHRAATPGTGEPGESSKAGEQGETSEPGESSAGAPGAVHDHEPRRLPWLLAIPALLLLFVVPAPLSALGASGGSQVASARIAAAAKDLPPLPPGPAPEISVLDVYLHTAAEDGVLDDREVTIVGSLLRDGDAVQIARVVIFCCAADAKAIAVRVSPDTQAALDGVGQEEWVDAVIKVVPGSATKDNGYVPKVRVLRATPIPAPANPYAAPAR